MSNSGHLPLVSAGAGKTTTIRTIAGLMPSLAEKMMETIVKVNRKGRTILLMEQKAKEAFEISH